MSTWEDASEIVTALSRFEVATRADEMKGTRDPEEFAIIEMEFRDARTDLLDILQAQDELLRADEDDDEEDVCFESIVGDAGFLYGLDNDGGVWMFSHVDFAWGKLPDPDPGDDGQGPELVGLGFDDGRHSRIRCPKCGNEENFVEVEAENKRTCGRCYHVMRMV